MKNILSFILCLLVAAFMVYEISGSGGIFIIVLLLSALLISVFTMIISAVGLKVDLSLNTDIVNKGEEFEARLDILKKYFLPTCFVEVTVAFTPNIISRRENRTYKFVCARLRGDTVEVPLKAVLCGMGTVKIEKIVLSDYLGLITKKVKLLPEEREIKIIPHIPDAGSQTEVLRSTSDTQVFDDSDEESDETSSVLTGVPGYEHRGYMPGDPLKRINWKLSSKRDNLMVRLDEKVTASSRVFQLDCPLPKEPNFGYYSNMDLIVESALALLAMLIRSGYESEFNYYIEGWEMVSVKDEKDLQYLQERLACLKPYPAEHRFPEKNINAKGKAMMCFTSVTADMQSELDALLDSFRGGLVVTEQSLIEKQREDMWSVNSDFEFIKTK